MSDPIFKRLPAEVLALGSPLAYYVNRPFRLKRCSSVTLLQLLALIFVSLFLAGLFGVVATRQEDNFFYKFAGVLLLVGSGGLTAIGYCLWPALPVAHIRGVVTFPKGLALIAERETSIVAWTQIEQVFNKGLRLRTVEGRELTFPNSLDGVVLLGDLVLRETYDRLLLQAIVDIRAGKTVPFGSLGICHDGLLLEQTFLEWGHLGAVTIRAQRLLLCRRGSDEPFATLALESIPNQHILWRLIERALPGVANDSPLPESGSQSERIARVPSSLRPSAGARAAVAPDPVSTTKHGSPNVPIREPREFSVNRKSTWLWFFFGIAALVLSPLAVVRGIQGNSARLLKIGGCMLVAGTALSARAIATRGMLVRVSAEGLSSQGVWRTFTCRWEDIEEATWERRKEPTIRPAIAFVRLYHLRCRDGRQVSLDDRISEFERLVEYVQQETTRCLLPGYLERLREGQTLLFGPIVVTRHGIDCQTTLIDWSQLENAWIRNDTISFGKRGSWIAWGLRNVTEVPNAHLLVALVNAIRSGALNPTR